MKILFLFVMVTALSSHLHSQSQQWKGKKTAVVLTYDDALNIHLDQ
ncbi:MAG: chitooligosaccharide deacetylase, partial [Sphingobacteriales bacterium]